MSMRRRLLVSLSVSVGIYLIISLSRDLTELFEARDRLEEEEIAVARLEVEQQELARELEYVISDEFVEQEARDRLLMSKPDEAVGILPEEGDLSEKEREMDENERELGNWEKWVRLFL